LSIGELIDNKDAKEEEGQVFIRKMEVREPLGLLMF